MTRFLWWLTSNILTFLEIHLCKGGDWMLSLGHRHSHSLDRRFAFSTSATASSSLTCTINAVINVLSLIYSSQRETPCASDPKFWSHRQHYWFVFDPLAIFRTIRRNSMERLSPRTTFRRPCITTPWRTRFRRWDRYSWCRAFVLCHCLLDQPITSLVLFTVSLILCWQMWCTGFSYRHRICASSIPMALEPPSTASKCLCWGSL